MTKETKKEIGLKPGESYKINVVAQVTYGKEFGFVVPYQQEIITMPGTLADSSYSSIGQSFEPTHILFVLTFLVFAAICGCILCRAGNEDKSEPCKRFLQVITCGKYGGSRRRPGTRKEKMQQELGMYSVAGDTSRASVDYNPPTAYSLEGDQEEKAPIPHSVGDL